MISNDGIVKVHVLKLKQWRNRENEVLDLRARSCFDIFGLSGRPVGDIDKTGILYGFWQYICALNVRDMIHLSSALG